MLLEFNSFIIEEVTENCSSLISDNFLKTYSLTKSYFSDLIKTLIEIH